MRFCDRLTEALIYFAVIFGPWAFGTTQEWSIDVMNGVGLTLGLLWLIKLKLRTAGVRVWRWSDLGGGIGPNHGGSSVLRRLSSVVCPPPSALRPPSSAERSFTWWLGAGTIFVLLYCLVSAVNARAIFQPDQWHFEYRQASLWLPHSYDQAASWAAFWKYLALAGFFWALRDWLLTLSPKEAARLVSGQVELSSARLPIRLRRLFWVLAANGAALAIQGLMQRVEGCGELLWLIQPRINTTADAQFGPYAYRSNAAQYFNLLWPAVLGFWWAGVNSLRRRRSADVSARRHRLATLLPCVFIVAICPLVALSRGGAIVLVGSVVMAAGILIVAQWRQSWRTKLAVLSATACVLVVGAVLGWQALAPRMEMIHEGYDVREGLYLTGRYMAQDNPVYGTGPGTFASMFPLYHRYEPDEWLAQMHNDWLETRITFGWLGTVPVILLLFWVLTHWFRGRGIYGNTYFVMLLWLSLGGCLLHAAFDFPFQIHSILTLFLTLCAVLSCLARKA